MAYYMLGRTRMAQKKFVEAVGAYEKCRALYRQQSGRQYANAQERQRNRDTRLREIDEVIRSYQSAPPTPQVVGRHPAAAESSGATIEEADVPRQFNDDARISRSRRTCRPRSAAPTSASGNLAAAEREYKAAVEADGKAGEAHSNLAVVYMETGRLDDAEKSIKAAEKVGFKVNPQLKDEIKNRRKAGTS